MRGYMNKRGEKQQGCARVWVEMIPRSCMFSYDKVPLFLGGGGSAELSLVYSNIF